MRHLTRYSTSTDASSPQIKRAPPTEQPSAFKRPPLVDEDRVGIFGPYGTSTRIEQQPCGSTTTVRRVVLDPSTLLDVPAAPPSLPTQSALGPDIRGVNLIRGLFPVFGGPAIIGPSLCVDAILLAADANSIIELLTELWTGDTSALETKTRRSPVRP
jgi:hypothetical protein